MCKVLCWRWSFGNTIQISLPESMAATRILPVSQKQLQGYLAHKTRNPSRTLSWAYALGPRGVLGMWAFSCERSTPAVADGGAEVASGAVTYRGTSRRRKRAPSRTPIGPKAKAFCRVLGSGTYERDTSVRIQATRRSKCTFWSLSWSG